MATPRTGIVLLQLGGPDRLESVEPFLYNLFCDPDIIDLPLAFLFRRSLARFISSRRALKVQEYYRKIGGRSPILKLTVRQARALERALAGRLDAVVTIAMRYWHPFTQEAIEQLQQAGVDRVILLPLYPQYSRTTTGSSANEWRRIARQRKGAPLPVEVIEEYCDHPQFVQAVVRNVGIALRRVPQADRTKVHLVFSAHGTPMALVRAGDPYEGHVRRSYDAVVAAGKWGLPHHLCYQSKVGPQKWLEPSLFATVDRLAAEGVTHMIVIPIAFVSDHSETLYEINMEVRRHALERGIRYYDMSPALNTNPHYIEALADLVLRKAGA
jgi:ferrochelatase